MELEELEATGTVSTPRLNGPVRRAGSGKGT